MVTHQNYKRTMRTQNDGLPQVPTQELVACNTDGHIILVDWWHSTHRAS